MQIKHNVLTSSPPSARSRLGCCVRLGVKVRLLNGRGFAGTSKKSQKKKQFRKKIRDSTEAKRNFELTSW